MTALLIIFALVGGIAIGSLLTAYVLASDEPTELRCAIAYAIDEKTVDGLSFLRLWQAGETTAIENYWHTWPAFRRQWLVSEAEED